jgi:hypothetical protein
MSRADDRIDLFAGAIRSAAEFAAVSACGLSRSTAEGER